MTCCLTSYVVRGEFFTPLTQISLSSSRYSTARAQQGANAIASEIKFTANKALERLARRLLPEIQKFFESDEGKREFEEWKKNKEKESK